ncbi:hypothetical protein K474DRAFT_1659005 [Panus rudis PR-1116 ss-1]|nr:hypothetical protein K474DRAFT_1659005 [Panus rudis PR-1116 ss-1]
MPPALRRSMPMSPDDVTVLSAAPQYPLLVCTGLDAICEPWMYPSRTGLHMKRPWSYYLPLSRTKHLVSSRMLRARLHRRFHSPNPGYPMIPRTQVSITPYSGPSLLGTGSCYGWSRAQPFSRTPPPQRTSGAFWQRTPTVELAPTCNGHIKPRA